MTALVAVLAGGRGRRLGMSKAVVDVGGAPLIERPLGAAAEARLDAVVVAKPETPLPPLAVPVWREATEPAHPLLGVVTALERAGRPVLALACDMPFVPGALLARLATGPEGVVRVAGRLEPFPARYEPAALPALHAALARRAPMREALAALDPHVLDERDLAALGDPVRMVVSVNTPDDLAAARRALAGDHGAPPSAARR